MANHASHAGLPYCVKGARYTILIPYLDADGDPTDPTTPDTEISKDGAAFADCAEEATTISGSNGSAYITLSGAETNCSMARVAAKVASGPKATLLDVKPRVFPVIASGTAQTGSASTLTLAAIAEGIASLYIGCILKTTGGTGGGGTGGANNQARVITGYSSARVATVSPDWETTPDNTTTYEILLTEASLFRFAEVKAMAPDVITSTAVAASAVTEIQSGLATQASVNTIDSRLGTPAGASMSADIAAVHDYVGTVEAAVGNVQTGVTTILDFRITATRTGYLDKLNISGNVAGSSEVTAIQNNTRVVRVVPDLIERPDSGTQTYRIELYLYDSIGNMEAPDSSPTIALVNQSGADRSSRLDSTTMSLVETGRYRAIYTADAADALEQLVWAFSVVEGGATRKYGNASIIVDTTAVDFTAADRTKLNTLHDTRIPGVIQPQTGDAYARLGAPTGASVSADVAAIKGDTAAIKAKTDNLPASPAAQAKLDTLHDTRIPGVIQPQTGDAYARLGAPTGASVSADVAAIKGDTAAIKAKTDNLPASPASQTKLDTIHDQMTEDDGGTRRFTANALEQAPGGAGSTPQLLVDTTVSGITSQTVFALTAGPTINDALNNQTIVLYDVSGSGNPSVRKILDYVGATKTVTIDAAPGFTLAAADAAKVFVTAAGATAPTESQVADAVLDALATQKVTIDRSTGDVTHYEPDGTTARGTRRLTEIDADVVGYVPV